MRDCFVEPTREGLAALAERGLDDEVLMLNLLRFRSVADYSQHPQLAPAETTSGQEAYKTYLRHTRPFVEAVGGTVKHTAALSGYLIGPPDESWDLALIVHYPTLAAFMAFVTNPAYLAGTGHRTAAVEDSRLLPLFPSRL